MVRLGIASPEQITAHLRFVRTTEPPGLLTSYLQACAEHGGTAPAGAGLDPFLPWTPPGRARRPASDQRQDPGRNPGSRKAGP